MVGELHSRGYQQLRIFPYGRSMWWRCELAPAELFDPENGACMESTSEHERSGLVARISSGGCCSPFDWQQDISLMPPERLADLFLKSFPSIALNSFGRDWCYAGWYQKMLLRTSPDVLPMAYSADEYEQTVHDPLYLFPVGEGATGGEMPLPPRFSVETTQPIKHSYWLAPGKILAGEYPGNKDEESARRKLKALLQSGVTAFIDLTEEKEGLLPYSVFLNSVSYQRFPIRDFSIPRSKIQTEKILDAIDHQISHGGLVYLHCWGGVGRTGVIAGCWLARHGFEGEAALAKLRERWLLCPKSINRICPETTEQEKYILGWGESRITP